MRSFVFLLMMLAMVLPGALHADPVELKLRLRVGDVYRHEVGFTHALQWQLGDETHEQEILMTYTIRWQVREFDDFDDSWLLRGHFERVHIVTSDLQGNVAREEDSRTGSRGDTIPVSMALALGGGEFDLWVYEDGSHFFEEVNVVWFNLTRRLLDMEYYSTTREAMDTTISWIDNHLSPILAMCFGEFPEDPIEVGMSWDMEMEWDEGLAVRAEHTLAEVEEGMAIIRSVTHMESQTGSGITMTYGRSSVISGDTTSNFESTVRLSDGWVMHGTGTMQMEGLQIEGYELPAQLSLKSGGQRVYTVRALE